MPHNSSSIQRRALTDKTHKNRSDVRRLFGRLWRDYLRPYKIPMAMAFVLMVIEGSTLGLLSWMLKPLFDKVFVDGNAQAIWWVGGVIFGLFLIRAVTSVGQRTLLTRVAQKSTANIQVDLLRHLMRLDTAYFRTNPPGALMDRLQGDTAVIQNAWAAIIMGVGRDTMSLVSLVAVALYIDVWWTLLAIVGTPLLIAPAVIAQRYIRKKTDLSRDVAALRSTQLDEVFHGIVPIKLNAMEDYQMSRFERVVGVIVKAMVKIEASRATIPALVDVITGLGFFMVLMVGGQDIIAGDKTVGDFMAFFSAMALAFQPMRRLGGIAGLSQIAAASLDRLYRILDTEPQILSPASPRPIPSDTSLELKDVALAYGEVTALNGVSFTAEAGKTTALVGASGAGKSTVFNVLTRLVDPQEGQVMVGGEDISALNIAELRALFSVVTQDAMLFDETLRDNILLGRQAVDPAQLDRVLKDAHISDFVDQLPQGLESPAGPRGSNISGGQRQRVAIARALLRDTPILLLDEATSALDAASEAVVQEALERLSKGRTTLVIAHRLSTIRGADKIVVMDKGVVVDEGTHDELLARDGIYADLCRLQFGED